MVMVRCAISRAELHHVPNLAKDVLSYTKTYYSFHRFVHEKINWTSPARLTAMQDVDNSRQVRKNLLMTPFTNQKPEPFHSLPCCYGEQNTDKTRRSTARFVSSLIPVNR
jgi:hypothetical protein